MELPQRPGSIEPLGVQAADRRTSTTWCFMSGTASTHTGLVMFIGIIHKRRRSAGVSGSRSVMWRRSASTKRPLKPLGSSKTCSAPTCMGISGVSR
jgi:hypothetical protein